LSVVLKLATEKDAYVWNEIVEKDPQGNFFDRFEWCQGASNGDNRKDYKRRRVLRLR
jgi:hypothetical protein